MAGQIVRLNVVNLPGAVSSCRKYRLDLSYSFARPCVGSERLTGSERLRPVDFPDATNAFQTGLRFFNRVEHFKDHLELTVAAGACFEMLSHAVKHSVDRHAIENPLSVLIQFIKAFRAGQLHFLSVLDHLEQPTDLFGV